MRLGLEVLGPRSCIPIQLEYAGAEIMQAHGRYSCPLVLALLLGVASAASAQTDPGPRGGPANAGGAAPGLGADYTNLFTAARARFQEIDSVSGGVAGENGNGLGPTFNANSCASCHAQPDVGGTSPHPSLGQVQRPNPQVAFATLDRLSGRNQVVPSFITAAGPVREARFIQNPDGSFDGGVHGLYTIAGRIDAPNCTAPQPDFATQLANGNIIFRIPTPIFGLGLIENVTDEALRANLASTASSRRNLGIRGRFNTTGNDGTITRFGWKAQNKSLLLFAGEAYNVEQGVTNEIFGNERGLAGTTGCSLNATPEDNSNVRQNGSLTGTLSQLSSDLVNFALFMRLSAPPASTTASVSEKNGQSVFSSIGCNLCHSTTLTTGQSPFPSQSGVAIHPYSDLALHRMSAGLADFVSQGAASPDEFRSAPLWGVGQRIFFLHDGRAGPANGGLVNAIQAHRSFSNDAACFFGASIGSDGVACSSEANAVVDNYNGLSAGQKQDLLNFLRSL
jgi:CxxC motif-containing protein (DUF1111 family)